jgi:regulator of protease activity HflC (stomatin/prohibitin superfamily)
VVAPRQARIDGQGAAVPGWVVFVVIAAMVVGFVGWYLLSDALVHIGSGHLGLVLFKGKATDRVLLPGPHFVLTIRRKLVEVYPSLELSYRAGGEGSIDVAETAFEFSGPRLVTVLGDRNTAVLDYVVRFRIDPAQLRPVHERFGATGVWAAVRDQSNAVVRTALGDPSIGVDDLFGPPRRELEARIGELVGDALAGDGFVLVLFAIGDIDLGRTGEVIQATARARHELAREEAEAATRVARARHDAELQGVVAGASMDTALRYREVDAWRDVAQTLVERNVPLPAPIARTAAATAAALDAEESPRREPVEAAEQ